MSQELIRGLVNTKVKPAGATLRLKNSTPNSSDASKIEAIPQLTNPENIPQHKVSKERDNLNLAAGDPNNLVTDLNLKPQTSNKKTKYWLSKKRYHEILRIVREKYPLAFNLEYKPLATGINNQLYQNLPEIAKADLEAFMAGYCRSNGYIAAHTTGLARVNLSGDIVGEVTAKHTEYKQRLKQIKAGKQQEVKPAGEENNASI